MKKLATLIILFGCFLTTNQSIAQANDKGVKYTYKKVILMA
jgi:hypothetical protein